MTERGDETSASGPAGELKDALFLLGVVLVIMGPIVGLLVFVGLAAAIAWFMIIPILFFLNEAYRVFQQSRRFADIPTSRLRSAAQGYVEVSGRLDTAGADFPRSPISDTPCHYWHLELVRRRQRGDESNNRWVSIKRMASARTILPFEDGTGSAYLLIQDLFFTPPNDYCKVYPRTTRLRAGDRKALEALRDRVPADLLKGLDGDGPWQVVERVLPASHPLFVTGLLRTIRSNESPTLRAAWGGQLDKHEMKTWDAEMRRIEGQGRKAPLTGSQRVNVIGVDSRTEFFAPIILASRHNVENFLIRTHWREAATALLWAAAFMGLGGTAAAIAADPARGVALLEAVQSLF